MRWQGRAEAGHLRCRDTSPSPRPAVTLQDLKVVSSYLKSCFLFPNYNLGRADGDGLQQYLPREYYAKIGEAAGLMLLPGPWVGGLAGLQASG